MTQCATCVPRLYKSIIDEVIASVRDDFLDEGIDEQVLLEVKQAWEQKVTSSQATNHTDGMGGTTSGLTQSTQQLQTQNIHQTAHQQVASGLNGQGSSQAPQQPIQPPAPAPANLVPVQITVPAQQAGGTSKTITIHVPSTALATGVAGAQLQTILSSPAAASTFAMEANQAAEVIQRQLNVALQKRGIALPPQLLQLGGQVDGAFSMDNSIPVCRCCAHGRSLSKSSIRVKKSASSCKASSSNRTKSVQVQEAVLNVSHESNSKETTNKEDRLHGAILSVDRASIDNVVLQRLSRLQVDGPIDDSSDEMSADDDDDDEDDKEEEEDKDKKFDDEDDDDEMGEANEEPLNSDDDVSEDESGETFEPENVVVCQYDKVSRVRNKWRFNLKDGIMNLKGKDYVFLKATGEGEW